MLYLLYDRYLYYQEKPPESSLAALPKVIKEDRVLLFAPHCDDETISSSAVLHDAVLAGSQVRVVVMTNGDGFTIAAEEQFRRLFLTGADYIRSGYSRQAETLNALGELGISPLQVTFFGYPDRGMESLWTTHWERGNPLQSHYTRTSHSPYTNSFEPQAPYSGESVLENIESVLTGFNPTIVLLPHPHDEHHDHAATCAFVTAALHKLNLDGRLPMPHLYYYLVHRGDFPIPSGYLPERSLLPPRPLLAVNSVEWYFYPLDQEAQNRKYRAVMKYPSQLKVPIMSKLLLSLIRTNELFAELPVPTVGSGGGGAALYTNPLTVHPVGLVENSRRVHTIACEVRNSDLWLQLNIPAFATSRWTYTLTCIGFGAEGQSWTREERTVSFTSQEAGTPREDIVFRRDGVEIRIPWQRPTDFFYIKVVAKDWWGFTPDETAWYLVLTGGR